MAQPPVKSVVIKPPPVPAADPSVRPGSLGSAIGKSIGGWLGKGGPVGSRIPVYRPPVAAPAVPTTRQGFVASPVPALRRPAPTPRTALKPVKVVIHPNGKIEIHHSAVASAPAVAATSGTAAPMTGVKLGPKAAGKMDPGGDRMRTPTAGAAATAPAAPVQTVEQQARALLAPVEKSTTDAINQRIAAEQAAINSSATTLAGLMGKYAPAAKAAYGGAEAGQSAVDAALGQTLSGQGQSGQNELTAKLAAIDADPATAARLAAQAGSNATGATGALAARGSSSLSNLIAQGVSAQDYGAKLPATAGMMGLQSTRAAQRQGTVDTANAIAQLEAKYPDLVQSIKAGNDRTAQLAFENKLAGYKATTARTAASTRATTAATKAQTAAGKVNLPLSKTYGILVNANAEPILRGGKTVPVPGSTTGGLSAKDFQKFQSQALGAARNYHGTWTTTDKSGNVTSNQPLSWQQFLTHGESAGIPINILIGEGRKVYSQAEIKQGLIPKGK